MRVAIVLVAIIMASSVNAQNTGLYGKRFCVALDGVGWIPLFNSFDNYSSTYKNKGGKLREGVDFFDSRLQLSTSYAVKNNIALGIELGMDFSNLKAETNLDRYNPASGYMEYMDLRHEMYKTRTLTVIPKIEFTGESGLLPIGLNHQLGFGYTSTKIRQHDYLYDIHYTYSEDPNNPLTIEDELSEKLYNSKSKGVNGFVLLYGLNVRTPINKYLMISYGMRYTLNIVPRSMLGNDYQSPSETNGYWLSNDEIVYDVRSRRLRSFISLNIGLAVAL